MDFDKLLNHEDYVLEIRNVRVMARNGVFAPEPELTYSPFIILDNLPDVFEKTVLDMGTGTGIIAVVCAKNGARVVAADIDGRAVANAKENVIANNVDVTVLQSDLFEHISGRFDYIFANLPILESFWNTETKTIIERFLTDAKDHLNKVGKIFLTWFSISDPQDVRSMIANANYRCAEFSTEKIGFRWYLFMIENGSS